MKKSFWLPVLLLVSCAMSPVTNFDDDKILTISESPIKSQILFHGSSRTDLVEIVPMKKASRSKKEGKVVFATPNIGFASIFIVRAHDDWSGSGKFCETCPFYFYCNNRERFMVEDKGGAIYFLPSNGFVSHLNRGMGADEWTLEHPVKPLYKINFQSGLDAMMNLGVQVFFIDQKTFATIKESEDDGKEILPNLQSENQKLNINPIPIVGIR